MATKVNSLILGAGPAGLGAAYALSNAGKKVVLIEKNEAVGGLARTLSFGAFKTDIGPHRFFTKNSDIYGIAAALLKDRLLTVDHLTRFCIRNQLFLYPIQPRNAFLNLGPVTVARIIADYLAARGRSLFTAIPPASFEDQIVSDFGRTLANLNFLNYTEKICGLPCSRISRDWARQRIKDLSLIEIVKSAFKMESKAKTLVDRFYYPRSGTSSLYDTMAEAVAAAQGGSFLKTRSYPVAVRHDGKRVTGVDIASGETREGFEPDHLISSIPVPEFIHLLTPKAPPEVVDAAGRLRFRSHVSLFVTFDRQSIFPDQWIYFPDKEVPFGRVSEPRNFCRDMSPEGKSSLLLEYFCRENDDVWNADKGSLFDTGMHWLQKLGFARREEAIDVFIHREQYAYPVYDLAYRENLDVVKRYLAGFENAICIGRSGIFRYNNQDHALEMGLAAARSVLTGKKHCLEEIGTEQEYFEKGPLKAS